MRPLRCIILHHSASPLLTTARQIKRWHQEKGWSDVGYHSIIEADGTRVPGRPIDKPGAHARGHNRDSIGICLVGDNTQQGCEWMQVQIDSAQELVDAYRTVFGPLALMGHRDVANTLCPGLEVRHYFDL